MVIGGWDIMLVGLKKAFRHPSKRNFIVYG